MLVAIRTPVSAKKSPTFDVKMERFVVAIEVLVGYIMGFCKSRASD